MTQDTLSRRDQFAMVAMAALIARPDLNVDQVAAMAVLQADVMVKRLDADARLSEDVRPRWPTPEEIADWLDGAKRWRQRDEPAPADSDETSEGARVRLSPERDNKQPFKQEVIAALARDLLDGEHVGVSDEISDKGQNLVQLVYSNGISTQRFLGHVVERPFWLSSIPDFLSRARRALA